MSDHKDNLKMTVFVSVIIATFNRAHCIASSIESVLAAFDAQDFKFEILVIDDCSIDNTDLVVSSQFRKYIDTGNLIYIKLPENRGVCGARNFGVQHAQGNWVIFLDSDDTLLPGSGVEIFSELKIYLDHPVIFFRCIDQNRKKVGINFSEHSKAIGLREYLIDGSSGECLTAINRVAISTIKFEEYLRGYEGLTIAKILKCTKNTAILSYVIARMYIQTGEDRLSSKAGFSKRLNLIGKGHFLIVKEFYNDMSKLAVIFFLIKSTTYRVLYFLITLNRLLHKIKFIPTEK